MAAKHTPAPWEAKGSYVFAGNDCIGIFDTDNASETRMKANAKLSAAAPDMLAALKNFVSEIRAYQHPECDECEIVGPLLRAADAALTKAEGRTDD